MPAVAAGAADVVVEGEVVTVAIVVGVAVCVFVVEVVGTAPCVVVGASASVVPAALPIVVGISSERVSEVVTGAGVEVVVGSSVVS